MKKYFGLFLTLFLLLSGSIAKPITKQSDTILDNEKISHAYVGGYMTDSDYNNLLKTNDTPIFIDEYYASQYFKNLNSNFGNNVYGTCTYVAIGMLLSFYDTYWDDNFIDDNYDVKLKEI